MANDSVGGFYASFDFGGNGNEFLTKLMDRMEAVEQNLRGRFSGSFSHAMDAVDEFAASCLDAGTDAQKLFAAIRKSEEEDRALEELAASARVAEKSLEELYYTGKDLEDLLQREAKETRDFERAVDSLAGNAPADFRKVEQSVESMDDRLSRLGNSWGKLRNVGLAVGAAMTAAGYGVWRLMDTQTTSADQAAKTARNMGMTVEAYTGLRFAAERGGVGTDQFNVALRTLAMQAGAGNEAFQKLGVDVNGANGMLKNSDVLFREVGAKLQGMEDRTMAASIASRIMGESGAKMISVFGDAPEVLDATIAEGQKLGAVISDQFAKDAEAFQDAVTNMKISLNGAFNTFVAGVAPKVTDFLNRLAVKIQEHSKSDAGKKLTEGIEKFADMAMRAFDVLVKLAPTLIEIGTRVGDILVPVAELVAKFMEIPGVADAVAVAIMAAFGGVAVSRVAAFGGDLLNLATSFGSVSKEASLAEGALASMGNGTAGMVGKVDTLRNALNNMGAAAKASLALMAAFAVYEAYKAVDGVIQERKDHKKTMEGIKAGDNFAKVQERLTAQLVEARNRGDVAEEANIRRKLADNRSSWSGVRTPEETASQSAKGDTNYHYNNITQNNTVRADISNIRDILDKNLDVLMKSHLRIEGVSRRLAYMGAT
jgi:hypothetical protein